MSQHPSEMFRIAELEADNRRLRRLLDQRDAPGELRHRLRSTVAMLRTIIRRTADTERDFDNYVAHLEDRLDALMRAQTAADESGSVGLHHLLAEELLHYGVVEGERARLSGPEIELRPRAGQVMALAIHELMVNAVEHGQLGDGRGHLDIAWNIFGEGGIATLTLVWKEGGGTMKTAPSRPGFGTEVLRQTLSYELKADTSLDFEADGLRCTIVMALSEHLGRLASA